MNRKCRALFLFLFSMISFYTYAQGQFEVSGTIKGTDGEVLIGAVVKIKGTNVATLTDFDGKYKINVAKGNSILEFIYLGEKTEEKVGNRKIIDVTISTVKTLETVVVTGFQTISRERASGAFESMNKKILDKIPSSDITSVLKGQMAGVDVGKNGSIIIRGKSTLSGTKNSPLIVVDGFPIEGGIETLNPNNIESVTVLKDGAAASIWGARSGNGVIVITTKAAKQGDKNELEVNFNSFVRIGNRIDLDYANPIADATQQLELEKYFAQELYKYSPGSVYGPDVLTSINANSQRTEGAYLYAMLNKGLMSSDEVAKRVSELQNIDYKDDVNKYLLRNPIYQQYNLNLRGSTSKNSYNFSILYDKNMTDFVGTDNNRIVTEFKNNYRLNKSITLFASGYLSVKNEQNNGSNIGEIQSLASYDRLVNPDGSYNNHSADMNYGMRNYMNGLPFTYSWDKNLLQDVRSRDCNRNIIQARFQGGFEIKLFKGLKFTSKYQFEKLRSQMSQYDGPDSYFVRSLINKYSEVSSDRTQVASSYYPKGGIRRGIINDNLDTHNLRNQFDYRQVFNNKHEVSFILGNEIIENNTNSVREPWEFGVNPEMNGVVKLPDTNTQAKNYAGSQEPFTHVSIPNYDYTKRRYLSFYLNSSYTFDQKYTATFSIRTDASNIISSKAQYRYVPLWSAGLNWNAAEEKFISELGWFSRLNVRGSYGINAQDATGATNITTIYNEAGNRFNDYNIKGNVSSHGNPNLRWEKTKNFNVGIDYALRNGWLYGKVDLYRKKGVDLLYSRSLPSTMGFGDSMKMNYASMMNKGIELQIGTVVPIHKGISLTSELNYSYNNNEILDVESNNILVNDLAGSNSARKYIEGGRVGDYYAYVFDGYFNNTPYVLKKDGTRRSMNTPVPSTTNEEAQLLYNMGTTIAPHILGWTNTLQIDDFSVTAVITGKFGHVFAKSSVFSGSGVGYQTSFNKDLPNYVNNRWASDYPGLINSSTMNQLNSRANYTRALSSNVDNASFIRLNNIIFDYNFSNICRNIKWMKGIGGIKVYGEIRDLGLLWAANKWNMDPEYVEGLIKPATSYSIGIKINI